MRKKNYLMPYKIGILVFFMITSEIVSIVVENDETASGNRSEKNLSEEIEGYLELKTSSLI